MNGVSLHFLGQDNKETPKASEEIQFSDKERGFSRKRQSKSSSNQLCKDKSRSKSPQNLNSPFEEMQCNPQKLLTNEKSKRKGKRPAEAPEGRRKLRWAVF